MSHIVKHKDQKCKYKRLHIFLYYGHTTHLHTVFQYTTATAPGADCLTLSVLSDLEQNSREYFMHRKKRNNKNADKIFCCVFLFAHYVVFTVILLSQICSEIIIYITFDAQCIK